MSHLVGLLTSLARLGAWLILLSAIFLPLEHFFGRPRSGRSRKMSGQDLSYFFANGLVPGLLLALPLSAVAWGAHAWMPERLQVSIAAWPLWLRVTVGFVVGEIGFYWGHRWAHEIPYLWRFHSVHHAPQHIYFLVSARAHPLDNVFIRLCGLIPACLLGVASPLTPDGSWVPLVIVLAATAWGFFIHADLGWRFGPLEWLIATPAFHHWHHTRDDHRDRNYASMLPCVDRIFGTHYLPSDRWPSAYGIEATLPATVWGQWTLPFRRRPIPDTRSATPAAGV